MPHPTVDISLSPQQRLILEYVRAAGDGGIDTSDLISRVYAGTIDGGPLEARKVIHVSISRINKKLKAKGFRLRGMSNGRATDGTYYLVKLETPCAS